MSVTRKINRKARRAFLTHAVLLITRETDTNVRFSHAADFFEAMDQARVDNSVDCTFPPFLSPDLPILDDLGLHRLTAQQCAVHML